MSVVIFGPVVIFFLVAGGSEISSLMIILGYMLYKKNHVSLDLGSSYDMLK